MAKKESFNSKFIASQQKIDGQGKKGKLMGKGKGNTMASFDMPAHGTFLDTQDQPDFNAYKVTKRGDKELEK